MITANSQDIDRIKAAADLIEEVDEFTTYLGFCLSGTTLDTEAKWSIMKIVQNGSAYPILTSMLWADGLCCFNLQFSARAGYIYSFKKF